MTDHAAEARECLIDWQETVSEAWREQMLPAVAQVHATLALADEQRTANQLAWLAFRSTDGIVASDTDVFLDVAARLGLTPTTPNQEQ